MPINIKKLKDFVSENPAPENKDEAREKRMKIINDVYSGNQSSVSPPTEVKKRVDSQGNVDYVHPDGSISIERPGENNAAFEAKANAYARKQPTMVEITPKEQRRVEKEHDSIMDERENEILREKSGRELSGTDLERLKQSGIEYADRLLASTPDYAARLKAPDLIPKKKTFGDAVNDAHYSYYSDSAYKDGINTLRKDLYDKWEKQILEENKNFEEQAAGLDPASKGKIYEGMAFNPSDELANYQAADQLLKSAENTLNTPRNGEGNLWDTFKSLGKRTMENIPAIASLGFSNIKNTAQFHKVISKLDEKKAFENPESVLSDSENTLLDAYAEKLLVDMYRANDKSWWSKGGEISADAIPFIEEMMLTGGITSGAKSAAEKALLKTVAKRVEGKLLGKLTGNLGKVGINAIDAGSRSLISPSTYSKTISGLYDIDPNENIIINNGKLNITGAQKNSVVDSFRDSAIDNSIEIFTEMGGAFSGVGKFLTKNPAAKKIAKTALGTKLGNLADVFNNSAGGRLAKEGFYNGIIGETMEELEGAIYRGEIGDFFKSENIVPMIIGFSLPGIATGSVSVTDYGISKRKFDNADNKLNQTLSNIGYNEQDIQDIKDLMLESPVELLEQSIQMVTSNQNLNETQKKELDKALNGFAINYANFSVFDKAMGKNLLQKRQQFKEELQNASEQANEIISSNVNKSTGTVMTAKVAGYENPVQIVSGNLVPNESGEGIDYEASDKEIYIKNGDKVEVVPQNMVEGLVDNIPAEEATNLAAQKIAAPVIAQMENDEVRPYEQGEYVRVGMPNGQSLFAPITGVNEDGSYSISVDLPTGAQTITIEPRQIVDEDNIRGLDNGSKVRYINESGVETTGEIEDIYMPELREEGIVVVDGKAVPVQNILGPEQNTENQNESNNSVIGKNADNLTENKAENAVVPPNGERQMSESVSAQQNQPTIEEIIARAPKQEKTGAVDYDLLLEQSPEDFAALYESEEGADETRSELQAVSDNIGKSIQSEQKKLEKATSINQRKQVKETVRALEAKKKAVDSVIQNRYTTPELEAPNQTTTEISQVGTDTQTQEQKNPEEFATSSGYSEGVAYLNSPTEITDEDFNNPYRDIVLPSLPDNTLNIVGSDAKPVLIKKSILEKNGETHLELSPEDSRNILTNALYNPNLVGQSQPQKHNHYWLTIKTGDKNSTVVIDVYPKKDEIEVVGWRYINDKGIEKLQRQAEREGGQILILSPNTGSAAALSALPFNLSSNKDTNNNSESQISEQESSVENASFLESQENTQENTVKMAEISEAEKEVDTNPTEKQKKTSNAKQKEQPQLNNQTDTELSETQSEAKESQIKANKKIASVRPDTGDFMSSSDYVEKMIEQHAKENGLDLDEFEGTDEWEKLYKRYQNSYPEYLKSVVEQYDNANDSGKGELDKQFENEGTSIDGIRSIIDDYLKFNENPFAVYIQGEDMPSGRYSTKKEAKAESDRLQSEGKKTKVVKEEEYTYRLQSTDEKFAPISRELFDKLIEILKQTGLAKDVIANAKKMREVLNSILGESGAKMFQKIVDLSAVNARFNEELDNLTDENADSKLIELGNPSPVLRASGIPGKTLKIYGNKILSKAKKHGYDPKELKNLPNSIINPIAVFKGSQDNTFSILTEMQIKGKNVIVAVDIDKSGAVDFNFVSSIYDKNGKGVVNWINKDESKYLDKEKSLNYLGSPALIAGATNNSEIDNAKIQKEIETAIEKVQNFENPKVSEENFRLQSFLKEKQLDDESEGQYAPIRLMATKKGEVYGFTTNGKVYIDPNLLNANTPIHEFGHLLWPTMPEDLRNEITGLLKQTPAWEKLSDNPAYSNLKTDDQKADEIFNTILGNRGENSIPVQEIIGKDITLFARITNSINKFWEWVKSVFGNPEAKINQIADMKLGELLGGKDLTASERITDKEDNGRISSQTVTEYADQSKYDFDVSGITEANAQEMKSIKEKAQADGTFMKAPNGKDTNLNERQWLQVRTDNFKKWFGDWQKEARIGKLLKSKSIEITGKEYEGKYELNRESAKQWLSDNLRSEYRISDTGETIHLSKVGVNKVTSHSTGNEAHLKSIVAIPEIINRATFIEELPAEKTDSKFDSYRYYVAGIKIGGVDYTAKVTIGVKQGKKYYDHALTEIEKGKLIDLINQSANNGFTTTGNASVPSYALSEYKDTKLLSILQNNSSKVVDENGEPMVVYHGSRSNFTYFDINKLKSGLFGTGFYFSPDISTGSAYAGYNGNLIRGFLNLKKPFELKDDNDFSSIDYINDRKNRKNYDGVIIGGKVPMYIAFAPNQIKFATANNGNFDNESDDIRFQFIGENGAADIDKAEEATTRLDNLGVAREMESTFRDDKDNKDSKLTKEQRQKIKIATGWERGADGKWRYEIPDIDINPETISKESLSKRFGSFNDFYDKIWDEKGARIPLSEFITGSNRLFSAYPQLKDVEVVLMHSDKMGSTYGSWDGKNKTLTLPTTRLDDENLKLSVVHEIQHAIQEIEGFAQGSTPRSAGKLKRKGEKNYDAYRRVSGEVESRNASRRINMTAQERRASLAEETEDVAREDQIFIYGGLGESGIMESAEAPKINPGEGIIEYANRVNEWRKNLENQNKGNNFAPVINNKGEINYDELDRQTDSVIGGRIRINALSLAEEQGRNRGGRRNVEASLLLRGSIGSDGSQQGYSRERQEELLKEYARRAGIWISPETIDEWKPVSDDITMESRVYYDGDHVVKVGYNYLNFYDTPLDFLTNKISLNNYLFPDAQLELIGFTETYGATKDVPSKFFAPVYRQKYVKGKVLSQSELPLLDTEMKKRGFAKKGYSSYVSPNYIIRDLHADNAMMTDDGDLIFIDTVPFLNTPDQKEGGSREYGDYSIAESSGVKESEIYTEENATDSEIRFQSILNPSTGFDLTEKQKEKLNNDLNNFWNRFAEAHQNAILPVEKWLNELRKNGMKISDFDDYFKRFTSIPGKIQTLTNVFRKSYFNPILKSVSDMQKKGYSYEEIGRYAMLKHAPERNESQRERAKKEYLEKNPDASQDKIDRILNNLPDNGISAIVDKIRGKEEAKRNPFNREQAEKFADDWVKKFEDKVGKSLVDDFWEKTKKATNWAVQKRFEAGLIDKEKKEEIISMYKNYVPLKGHADETAEDVFDYGTESGTFFTPQNKKAKGRSSEAEDPIAYIFSNAQSSVRESVNNTELKAIERIASQVQKDALSNKKKPTVTVSRTWFQKAGEKNGKAVWKIADEPQYPTNENLTEHQREEEYSKNIEDYENNMKELAEKGEAFQSGTKKLDIGLWIKPSQERMHDVHVWKNGVMHTVRFNLNPAIPIAINGANRVYAERHNAFINKSIKAIGGITRFLSTMYTTLRPAFAFYTNPARDFTMLASSVYIKDGALYEAKFLKNYAVSIAAIPLYMSGKGDINNKYIRYYSEYLMNGAKTGLSELLELKDIQKKVNRELKIAAKEGAGKLPLQTWDFIHSAFENANEWTENAGRFAVYVTSRESGKSVVQSVLDAKEITVNFNRKGSGAMGNSELRSLWAFVNVGIQGAQNITKIAIYHPFRFSAVVTAWASLGGLVMPYINSFLAGIFGDDDDKKWKEEFAKMSPYERNNNLCFYTGNGFVKIPIGQEYRMFNGFGTDLFMYSIGKSDAWDAAENLVFGMLELIAYNPVLDAHQGSPADALPTAAVPIGQIELNKTFTGSPIYNQWAKESLPMYRQVRTNKKGEPYTPKPVIEAEEWLNKITGGDEVRPGWISKIKADKIDLSNPDVVNHLMSSYIGALYNPLVRQIENLGSDETVQKKLKKFFVPGAMYKSIDDLPNIDKYTSDKYYEIKSEIGKSYDQYRAYAKESGGNIDYLNNKMNEHPEIKKYAVLRGYINNINELQEWLKNLTGDEQKKREILIDTRKRELIERYNKIK